MCQAKPGRRCSADMTTTLQRYSEEVGSAIRDGDTATVAALMPRIERATMDFYGTRQGLEEARKRRQFSSPEEQRKIDAQLAAAHQLAESRDHAANALKSVPDLPKRTRAMIADIMEDELYAQAEAYQLCSECREDEVDQKRLAALTAARRKACDAAGVSEYPPNGLPLRPCEHCGKQSTQAHQCHGYDASSYSSVADAIPGMAEGLHYRHPSYTPEEVADRIAGRLDVHGTLDKVAMPESAAREMALAAAMNDAETRRSRDPHQQAAAAVKEQTFYADRDTLDALRGTVTPQVWNQLDAHTKRRLMGPATPGQSYYTAVAPHTPSPLDPNYPRAQQDTPFTGTTKGNTPLVDPVVPTDPNLSRDHVVFTSKSDAEAWLAMRSDQPGMERYRIGKVLYRGAGKWADPDATTTLIGGGEPCDYEKAMARLSAAEQSSPDLVTTTALREQIEWMWGKQHENRT